MNKKSPRFDLRFCLILIQTHLDECRARINTKMIEVNKWFAFRHLFFSTLGSSLLLCERIAHYNQTQPHLCDLLLPYLIYLLVGSFRFCRTPFMPIPLYSIDTRIFRELITEGELYIENLDMFYKGCTIIRKA